MPGPNTWTKVTNQPAIAYLLTLWERDPNTGLFYALAGRNAGAGTVADSARYDPVAGTWDAAAVAECPVKSDFVGQQKGFIDGYFYKLGGSGVGNEQQVNLHRYDPNANTWAGLTGFVVGAGVNVSDVRATVLDGKLHALCEDAHRQYDPQTDSWSNLALPPEVLNKSGLLAFDHGLLAVGGETPAVVLRPTVQHYDAATDSWTTKNPFPFPAAADALHTCGLLYAGGRVWLCGDSSASTNWLKLYDPVADEWTAKANLATSVSAMKPMVFHDGLIWMLGKTNGAADHFYFYEPDVSMAVDDDIADEPWGWGIAR